MADKSCKSVSDNVAVQFRYNVGHVERAHDIEAATDFCRIRWRFLERSQSVRNMVAVNIKDSIMVAYFHVLNGRLRGNFRHALLPTLDEYSVFTVRKGF